MLVILVVSILVIVSLFIYIRIQEKRIDDLERYKKETQDRLEFQMDKISELEKIVYSTQRLDRR